MSERKDKEVYEGEVVEVESQKPLVIFKTDEDKYGRDIALMSDFFDGYVQQMSLVIKEESELEILKTLPIADVGIIGDVIHQANIIMQGNMTLLPDLDNLPTDIKNKLKKGVYNIGESKQVDGNLRAVVLDENGVRIKDITLKKVLNNAGNIETIRSIGNQLQMRQIYMKLADIQEMQSYQLEKDRDRDIIVPFLDARSLVLESETKPNEERVSLLKQADGKIRNALNSIYADIETTSKRLAKQVSIPFWTSSKQVNTYMGFLATDLQLATKYVGVRMHLLEYMGDGETAKSVLQSYQHVVYDFLTKSVTRKGLSTVDLMHNYFPYDKTNFNSWYTFSQEMTPVLEKNIKALELSMSDVCANNIYVVAVEDIEDEEE